MGRPHWHPKACRSCGARAEDGVHISQAGNCPDCGNAKMRQNYRELRARSGPRFTQWRRALAASVGGVLLDDVSDES